MFENVSCLPDKQQQEANAAAWAAYYGQQQNYYGQGQNGQQAQSPAYQQQQQQQSPAQPAANTPGAWRHFITQQHRWHFLDEFCLLLAPSINPATGQPDYSMAWAEYYRQQGMHAHAQAILQQAQTGQPGQQAPQ